MIQPVQPCLYSSVATFFSSSLAPSDFFAFWKSGYWSCQALWSSGKTITRSGSEVKSEVRLSRVKSTGEQFNSPLAEARKLNDTAILSNR